MFTHQVLHPWHLLVATVSPRARGSQAFAGAGPCLFGVAIEKHSIQDADLLLPGEGMGPLPRCIGPGVPSPFVEPESANVGTGPVGDVATFSAGLTASQGDIRPFG